MNCNESGIKKEKKIGITMIMFVILLFTKILIYCTDKSLDEKYWQSERRVDLLQLTDQRVGINYTVSKLNILYLLINHCKFIPYDFHLMYIIHQ